MMEPDQMEDKAATRDIRTKIAFFKSAATAMQDKKLPLRKGPAPPISAKPGKANPTRVSEAERFSLNFDEQLRSKINEVSTRKNSGFSPNDMEVFQKPLCLVSTEGTKLKLETEVTEQISKIDWPIIVVSIVGLYRTGKSYLMNRLAGSTTGFALGDTIESETKGIWVWCKIHPEKLNTVLLLLDTEGLGDVDKGDPSHDNKIFTIATLLCNCLVYNTKGAFDQDVIGKLTFITEMAKNIRFQGNSSDNNSSLKLILPDFVLCVRDFSLKLFKKGKNMTEDEYLESSLATKEDKDDKFNKPRECIRNYFPVRKCFTLPVPGDGDVLENLDTLQFSDLSNKFKEATNRFVTYIYSCQPKELLASKPINGQMFATLVTQYVVAIREGAVPDVDDAFSAVAKIENARVEKEALEIYKKEFEDITLPLASRALEKCYTKAQQKALGYLRENVVHDKEGQFEQQAQLKMDSSMDKIKEENTKMIGELCHYELERIYKETMEDNLEKKVYEVSDGYKVFQQDINKLKDVYLSTLQNFEEHEILLTWCGFLDTMKEKETQIIEADECMSKKEKEDERRRNEENIQNMIEKHKKNQAHALDNQRKTMDAHFSNLNRERRQQHEQEMQKLQNLFDSKLRNEREESRDLMYKTAKANEEKMNRLLRDEQSRHEDSMNKMMEQQRKSHAESIQMQQKETARIRAERETLRKKIREKEDEMHEISEQNRSAEEELRTMEGKERTRKNQGVVGRVLGALFNN